MAASACAPAESPPSKDPSPLAVRTARVSTGSIQQTAAYVGTVRSTNEINVLARISGRLADLPIREGERAKSGGVLARMVAPETDARVSRIQADVARIREESAFLCRQAEIDAILLASNATSRVQVDASRLKCDSSRAAQKAAEAGLTEMDALAGNRVERAPFAGQVLRWLAEPGENVMPGRPLLLFGDGPLEVRVRVHEKDIARGIGIGTPAILRQDPLPPIRATVAVESPLASGPGRMVEVRIPIPAADAARFRHGTSVDVAFVLDETHGGLAVPTEALVRAKGRVGVYRVKEDRAQWVDVRPMAREGRLVAVEGALQSGDPVVVGNLEAVSDGLVVWPVPVEGVAP